MQHVGEMVTPALMRWVLAYQLKSGMIICSTCRVYKQALASTWKISTGKPLLHLRLQLQKTLIICPNCHKKVEKWKGHWQCVVLDTVTLFRLNIYMVSLQDEYKNLALFADETILHSDYISRPTWLPYSKCKQLLLLTHMGRCTSGKS